MNENVSQYAPAIASWASMVPFRLRIYLFGSRINGIPRPDSDLDIALEFLDSSEIEDRTRLWFNFHGYWEKQLARILPCKPHLVLFEGSESELMQKYLENDPSFIIYESDSEIPLAGR
jgi:predicted nucleotidyltransferase